jgi:glycosyltransferase involved in cell wall biosynthesis
MSLALLLGPQLRAYADAGMEVVGASAPGPWADELASLGVRHVPLSHLTRSLALGEDAQAVVELVRVFRRLRPDIVHTHNPKPGIYGRLAARLAGVPVVVNTVHGLYATSDDTRLRRTVVYGLERVASACSRAELVQNIEDLVTLERLRVPRNKLVLLGNGIDLQRFRPRNEDAVARAREELGVTRDQVVAGTVGRLVWEKGLAELFAAARRLRRTRPDVVVVVVGPTDPAKGDGLTQADVAAAEASGNVRMLGERRDVEDLYPAFDMFVLPSYREGFPRSAMEASACGVPVVATDIRGCRQVVADGTTGLLVPVRDPDALADAVEELADDPARRRAMGHAARRRAEAEFDDRRVIEITLDTYGRLLDDPRSVAAPTPSAAVAGAGAQGAGSREGAQGDPAPDGWERTG